jgi:hypothetical protein
LCKIANLPATQGSGTVTGVGLNSINVSGNNIFYDECSSVQYKPGTKGFAMSDKVAFEVYSNGGRQVARKLVFT